MCESKDKIPLCWHCRWIVGIFFLAVLIMWGVICFLEKPGQQEALSHWISVLIFLVTIVCTAIPLYMNNRYLELEREVRSQKEDLEDKINNAIEEQKKLKNDIEKQKADLTGDIESILGTCSELYFIFAVNYEAKDEKGKKIVLLLFNSAFYFSVRGEKTNDTIQCLLADMNEFVRSEKLPTLRISENRVILPAEMLQRTAETSRLYQLYKEIYSKIAPWMFEE